MEVTFHPKKNRSNFRDHGVLLSEAARFDLETALIELDDREDYGEDRWNALGFLDGKLYSFTFTYREDGIAPSACARPPITRRQSMPNTEPEFGTPTHDNPEWTADRAKRAMRFSDLPAAVQAAAKKKGRGPQKLPTKEMVSIRLSADVVRALRETGPGWQARADDSLRRAFVEAPAAK